MELVKDIYFNTDKLVENTKVKVSYTGKFYQGNDDKVFIHYGYGKDWNGVKEVEMSKTDLGYQTELDLNGCDTLNFCFKNQNNEWDNNLGNNYIFNIEKVPNIDGVGNNTPNSVDTILPNLDGDNKFKVVPQGPTNFEKPEDDNCFKIIPPSFDNKIEDDKKCEPVVQNQQAEVKTQNINTSITLAPTGFEYWSKRIKDSVCKFFNYIPKFVSGNYKRIVANINNYNNNKK